MGIPDYVPTLAGLTGTDTQLVSLCHWHKKKKDKQTEQRCGNLVSNDDVQKRTALIQTLRRHISSGATKANSSCHISNSYEPSSIKDLLKELSELILCKRWHRDESTAIYTKWSLELEQVKKSSSASTKLDIRKEFNIEDDKILLCQGSRSKGIKCRNSIGTESLECANAFLDVVENFRDSSPTTRDNVLVVAQLLICHQCPQEQATEKAEEWFKKIQKLFPLATSPPEQRSNGSQRSAARQSCATPQPSTPASSRTTIRNDKTPQSSVSSVWSRTNSVTISTPITSPPSQRQSAPSDASHGSPCQARRAKIEKDTSDIGQQRLAHNRLTRSTAHQPERGLSPSEPEFKTFSPPNKDRTFWNDLHKFLLASLTTQSKASGHIYGFQRELEKYIKIGYTTKTVESRVLEWEGSCKQKFTVVLAQPVPNAYKVEKLIHLILYHERRSETHCKSCNKKHIEWFEVALERAKQVLSICKRWFESKPYDKEGKLKPFWIKHIDKLFKERRNSSPESWRDWIDTAALARSTSVDVKTESVADGQAAAASARVKTNLTAARTDAKNDAKAKTPAYIHELTTEFSRVNRDFIESMIELEAERAKGRPPAAYPAATQAFPSHIGDPFVASPVTAVAA